MHAAGYAYLEDHMEEACYRIGIILANNLKQCSCHYLIGNVIFGNVILEQNCAEE
jgi:hypothetical protein